jgi:hypothetical protein
MRTVFVPSQFYTLQDLYESKKKPDFTVKDICELSKILPKIVDDIQSKT